MKFANKGFTLLETLLAILLLSIGATALIWALNAGLFASTDIDNIELALNIGQSKMEEIKNTTYSSIVSAAKATVPKFSNFQQKVTVAAIQTDLKQIDVTVYWTTQGGETNISLSTYAANG